MLDDAVLLVAILQIAMGPCRTVHYKTVLETGHSSRYALTPLIRVICAAAWLLTVWIASDMKLPDAALAESDLATCFQFDDTIRY